MDETIDKLYTSDQNVDSNNNDLANNNVINNLSNFDHFQNSLDLQGESSASDHNDSFSNDHSVINPEDHTVINSEDHAVINSEDYTVINSEDHTVINSEDNIVINSEDHTKLNPEVHTEKDQEDHAKGTEEDHVSENKEDHIPKNQKNQTEKNQDDQKQINQKSLQDNFSRRRTETSEWLNLNFLSDNKNQNIGNASFSNLPLEVVEYILAKVQDVETQTRCLQVCRLWRNLILRLRWLRLESFHRKYHHRPAYTGEMGDNLGLDRFSILITVCSPVLLAGVGVYLPIRSCESGLRVSVDLIEHGTASSGPAGDMVASRSLYISRSSLATWPHKFRGAKLVQIEAEGDQCKEDPGRGLHPLPVMFDQLVELQTSIRYMLTLCFDKENEDHQESETLGSVWGFQGPPPSRKIEEEENYFRWFQVKRPGSRSSGSNKQFPIIYYLS